jgi:hypothetical protein
MILEHETVLAAVKSLQFLSYTCTISVTLPYEKTHKGICHHRHRRRHHPLCSLLRLKKRHFIGSLVYIVSNESNCERGFRRARKEWNGAYFQEY